MVNTNCKRFKKQHMKQPKKLKCWKTRPGQHCAAFLPRGEQYIKGGCYPNP